jgi:hypothetical protein
VPLLHRFKVGGEDAPIPFAEPHAPSVELVVALSRGAEHDAAVPPFDPGQVHIHGPVPLTTGVVLLLCLFLVLILPTRSLLALLVSALVDVPHRFDVGFEETATPFAEPHAPLTPLVVALDCVEHDASVPPFDPAQVQVHGALLLTVEAVPVLHRLEIGAEETLVPFTNPHAPLTAVVLALDCAEHCTTAPLFDPPQVHVHGPLPLTAEAVPIMHNEQVIPVFPFTHDVEGA